MITDKGETFYDEFYLAPFIIIYFDGHWISHKESIRELYFLPSV